MKKCFALLFFLLISGYLQAQNPKDLGGWYMYFGNFRWKDSPWAIHGEMQIRNFKTVSDLDQLLLRSGIQYNSKSGQTSFLAGYASITNGTAGDSEATLYENRLYQEAIIRQKTGKIGFMHRYRYEQRWIENQDFRTRFRYAFFLNLPLNSKELTDKGSIYLQVYDEIFINGERPTPQIQFFDRNRFYAGLGFRIQKGIAFQLGFMEQTTNSLSKGQIQVGIHQQLLSK